jgi:DNA-binding phage protein
VYKPAIKPDDHVRFTLHLWRANAVAELLAAAPQLDISGAAFKANLRACIQDVAEGNVLAFAEVVQLSRPGLDRLTYGKGLPEMATLLQICHRAGVSLAVFLASHPVPDAATWDQLKQALQTGRKGCRIPLGRSREQVRAAMRRVIHEQPPPSLSEIAQRLNYRGSRGAPGRGQRAIEAARC